MQEGKYMNDELFLESKELYEDKEQICPCCK